MNNGIQVKEKDGKISDFTSSMRLPGIDVGRDIGCVVTGGVVVVIVIAVDRC